MTSPRESDRVQHRYSTTLKPLTPTLHSTLVEKKLYEYMLNVVKRQNAIYALFLDSLLVDVDGYEKIKNVVEPVLAIILLCIWEVGGKERTVQEEIVPDVPSELVEERRLCFPAAAAEHELDDAYKAREDKQVSHELVRSGTHEADEGNEQLRVHEDGRDPVWKSRLRQPNCCQSSNNGENGNNQRRQVGHGQREVGNQCNESTIKKVRDHSASRVGR